jgi:hypothetical protein
MSSVKPPKGCVLTQPNFWLIVDSFTRMEFTESHAKKSDMPDATCWLFQALKEQGLTVQRLYLAAQLKSKEWQHPVKIEFTAHDTPQQNSLVETAFVVNTQRASAVLGAAKIPELIELNGIVKSRIEHFMGAKPNWAINLRKFGEAGMVKTRTKQQLKLADCGIICIFVGYPKNHPANTYLMYNEHTRMMRTTRNVIWLNRMYFDSSNHPDVDTVVPIVDAQEGTFDFN